MNPADVVVGRAGELEQALCGVLPQHACPCNQTRMVVQAMMIIWLAQQQLELAQTWDSR